MEREMRYIVVKYKDVAAHLSGDEAVALIELVKKVEKGRADAGKPPLECVCVESDWPEYHDVWTMIAARVDGVPLYKAGMQQFTDYDNSADTAKASRSRE